VVGTPSYTGAGTFTLALNPGNFDGFGSFTYALDSSVNGSSSNNNNATNTLTFVVTSASGSLTLNDVDQLSTTNNGNNQLFAVDVSGCNATVTANCTGPIAGSTPVVPEPTSIAFFGTGLVGLGVLLRRKFARS